MWTVIDIPIHISSLVHISRPIYGVSGRFEATGAVEVVVNGP